LLADKSIQETADLLGFDSVYYFSRLFKSRTGSSPSAFRPE
jgi:AraC-like DNA-binding protein